MTTHNYKLGTAFGRAVDISSRQSGSADAIKDLGVAGIMPPTAAPDKTRIGTPVQKPPKLKIAPASKYTTSGALLNPKVASEADAPNYGNASSSTTSCAFCKSYEKQDDLMGHCTQYDFYTNAHYTCDRWASREHRAPSQFIKIKQR